MPAPAPVAPVDNTSSPAVSRAVREAQIIAMLQGGLSSGAIAKALRMPASSVRDKARRLRGDGKLGFVRPADDIGASRIASIVESIEAEAARRTKMARQDYTAATLALKIEHRTRQDAIAHLEAEELKAIERWRVQMIADAEGGPVSLSDMRSVRREEPPSRLVCQGDCS